MPAKRSRSAARDYVEAIFVAAIIAVVLRAFVVQAYRIPSDSMVNTLLPGDYILVSKLAYQLGDPKPGDVLVFQYPLNPSKDFVKRCIAVEGQTVAIRDKAVYVDSQAAPVPPEVVFSDSRVIPANLSNRDNFGPVVVPPGYVFVLGDNRDDSRDSRDWGFLDRRLIRGEALFVYWSWTPDPRVPKWESPYILPILTIPFYNLVHFPQRMRWGRIGKSL